MVRKRLASVVVESEARGPHATNPVPILHDLAFDSTRRALSFHPKQVLPRRRPAPVTLQDRLGKRHRCGHAQRPIVERRTVNGTPEEHPTVAFRKGRRRKESGVANGNGIEGQLGNERGAQRVVGVTCEQGQIIQYPVRQRHRKRKFSGRKMGGRPFHVAVDLRTHTDKADDGGVIEHLRSRAQPRSQRKREPGKANRGLEE